MKKIKLTEKQLEILKHCLGEYEEFLNGIEEDQYKEHQEMRGKNLSNNLDRIFKKLY